ncbi:MAG: tetratricopeptide repeat protein [Gammaproteobacteria bacterium]|nr:tetratricopeptide repeat protein [Gammaproteobacteria bacterium]
MNHPEPPLDDDERLALIRWYVDQNRLDSALLEIKALLDDDASDEVLITAARLYAQLRLFVRAEDLFSRYIERNPDEANVRFQLGMTRFDAGNLSGALDTWQQVLNEDADNPSALFYSALARLQKGEAGESEPMLQRIIDTTHEDNLYHGKARDLLAMRQQGTSAEAETGVVEPGKNPYTTEH